MRAYQCMSCHKDSESPDSIEAVRLMVCLPCYCKGLETERDLAEQEVRDLEGQLEAVIDEKEDLARDLSWSDDEVTKLERALEVMKVELEMAQGI